MIDFEEEKEEEEENKLVIINGNENTKNDKIQKHDLQSTLIHSR